MKFIILFLISTIVFASNDVTIVKIRGQVKYNDEVIDKDSIITQSGKIQTSKRSFIKIKINKWGNTVVLGPNSKMNIDLGKDFKTKKVGLLHGAFRWIGKHNKKSKNNGRIYTRTASLGVRGTDFFLKANELLGESEIVLFDGLVNFANINDSNDAELIKKGQWGGIGGRYGTKVKVIDSLPSNVIKHFDKLLKL